MAEVKCHRVYIIGIAFTFFLHDKEIIDHLILV